MTLTSHLNAYSPIIWVTTSEPHLVINALEDHVVQSERRCFRIHPSDGLVEYRDGSWVMVLEEVLEADGSTSVYPIDQNLAFYISFILRVDGVLLIENGHIVGDSISGWAYELVRSWMKIMQEDNLFNPHATLILTAPDSEKIPVTYKSYMSIVELDYPTEEEIHQIVSSIINKSVEKIHHDEISTLTRALRGLSHTAVLRTINQSLVEKKKLDSSYLNTHKIATIAHDSKIEIRTPKFKISDIGGMDQAKEMLDAIAWTWQNPQEAQALNIVPTKSVVLIGVPGTGKSMICEASADALGLDLATFGISKALGSFVGESEANMRAMFKQLKAMAPIVAWIDEFGRDTSGSGSSNMSDSGTTDRVHGEFLQGLQELPDNVFLMCAANRISDLPPEMTRAGRFDHFLFVGLPTEQERVEIFNIHLSEEERSRINVEQLAKATDTFTGAEIQNLILRTRFNVAARDKRTVTARDIGTAAPLFLNRVWLKNREAVFDMYHQALTDWDWASSAQYEDAGRIMDLARKQVKV